MSDIYIEVQYDLRREEVRLLASSGFGPGNKYNVTRPASTVEGAADEANAFVRLYRKCGATVHTDKGIFPPLGEGP